MTDHILYRAKGRVKVGQLERFTISFEPKESQITSTEAISSLWLKVKNTENITLRAAVLRGPYILYVDVRTEDYDHNNATFITADQPHFEPNLSPAQSFTTELPMHTIKQRYVWVVDILSQIIFSANTDVTFEILIGSSKDSLDLKCEKLGSFDQQLIVNRKDTLDLWNLPQQVPEKKAHLVVLTHGLHSNTGTDMFYMKEQLDDIAEKTGQSLIVRGFHENVCKTEKGIQWLGTRLATYVISELYNENITEISFIGHSLGGLVQTFAIAYIEINFPWFFKAVKPCNFITLATPFLGIVTDNPAYVKAALMFGVVGKTGQDLGLEYTNSKEPLLKLLPTGPTHKILKKFHNRTLYANALNDGIVPLYTSSLLFLDWKGLQQVSEIQNDQPQIKAESKNPIQKAMSLWAPMIGSEKGEGHNFPKTSMIESATSILIPSLPPTKYIVDPQSRENVILHDRVYTEADIPPPKVIKRKTFIENLDPMAKFQDLEDQIAREWHRDMTWRKVLVKLEPDAHNNIIVRRRFANAYGWGVVDHLVENHFKDLEEHKDEGSVSTPGDEENKKELEDLVNNGPDEELDLGLKTDIHWVNTKQEESLFDVGPTGLISNVNEILDNFRNWNMVNTLETSENPLTTEEEAEIQTYAEGYYGA